MIGGVLLHESGHALFDVLDVPVFGREEDAADQISVLVALHLRPQLAEAAVRRTPISGTWCPIDSGMSKDGKLNEDFADSHGTGSQPLIHGLSIVTATCRGVRQVRSAGRLPESRVKNCAREHASWRPRSSGRCCRPSSQAEGAGLRPVVDAR